MIYGSGHVLLQLFLFSFLVSILPCLSEEHPAFIEKNRLSPIFHTLNEIENQIGLAYTNWVIICDPASATRFTWLVLWPLKRKIEKMAYFPSFQRRALIKETSSSQNFNSHSWSCSYLFFITWFIFPLILGTTYLSPNKFSCLCQP